MRRFAVHLVASASVLLALAAIDPARPNAAQLAAKSGAECSFDLECDDGNPCTHDSCQIGAGEPVGSGACSNTPVLQGDAGDCDDGIFCNGIENCAPPQGGGPLVCTQGPPASCCELICDERGRCDVTSPNEGAICDDHGDCGGGWCERCPADCRVRRCSAESTNPGDACAGDGDCPSGRCMSANENCADTSQCNGTEICNVSTGLCLVGKNPCGPDAKCFDRRCEGGEADGGPCRNDSTCEGGVCDSSTLQCFKGRCCSLSIEPLCSKVNAAACTGNWYAGDAGYEENGPLGTGPCGGYDPIHSPNDAWGCPSYSAGITSTFAQSAVQPPVHLEAVGPVSISPAAAEIGSYTGPVSAIGDDYQLLGSTGIGVDAVRFAGGFIGSPGRLRVEFYDADERFVGQTSPIQIDGAGIRTQFIGVYPSISIPQSGFVVLRPLPPAETGAAAVLFVVSTDDIDAGSGSGGVLWLNDGPLSNFLPNGSPATLALELVGDPELPFGACCDLATGGCDVTPPWMCEGDGSAFRPGAYCAECVGGEFDGSDCSSNPGTCIGQGRCSNNFDRLCGTNADCPGEVNACNNADQFCVLNGDCPSPGICGASGTCSFGTCVSQECGLGACCISATGECEPAADESACSTLGGDFLGHGTQCDPNCCPQPTETGADQPAGAIVHNIVVPQSGDPLTVTIAGDNSAASNTAAAPDTCATLAGGFELGWWEAFHIDACANVRIDFCCSSPARRASWMFLAADTTCGTNIGPTPRADHFGEHESGVGSPYCHDANSWHSFVELPAGTYYVPVPSSLTGPTGAYQLHITVEACETGACCLAPNDPEYAMDHCDDDDPDGTGISATECKARGGFFLGPPNRHAVVAACAAGICDSGSCCTTPGTCGDGNTNLGVPYSQGSCNGAGGSFVPHVLCEGGRCAANSSYSCDSTEDCVNAGVGCPPTGNCCLGDPSTFAQPDPCLLCEHSDDRHCQQSGVLVRMSDTSADPPARAVDDFVPLATGVLSSLCVKGAYDGPAGWNCQDLSGGVQDQFTVRVFTASDVTGLPADLVGTWATTVTVNRAEPFDPGNNRDCFEYRLQLVPDVANPLPLLLGGHTYFVEVTNGTPGGHAQCFWQWLEADAAEGNRFALTDRGYTYQAHDAGEFDLALCTNLPFGPSEPYGGPVGACCTGESDRTCETLDFRRCREINGRWRPDLISCETLLCLPPANDQCAQAVVATDGPVAFDNFAAARDGAAQEACGGPPVIEGADIWFNYTATCTGTVRLSTCHPDSVGQHVISVYHSASTPGVCLCPGDAGFSLLGCSSVPQPNQVDPSGCPLATGAELVINVTQGHCYTLRISGELARTSPGQLRITCGSAACGNGIIESGNAEICDGEDDSLCQGACKPDCQCPAPVCGDGIASIGLGELCDGDDDENCPGLCMWDCQCPGECGDGIRQGTEECDDLDDDLCPGECNPPGLDGCTCVDMCGNGLQEPPEHCDGSNDDNCPGACTPPGPFGCRCPPPTCGDNAVQRLGGEECDGTATAELGALCEPADCRPPLDPAGECTCKCAVGPFPPDPITANPFGTCTGNNANCTAGGPACAVGACDPCGQVRSMSFQIPANSAGSDTAIRVRLTSLHHPSPNPPVGSPPNFSAFEGQYRYLNTIAGTVSRCCNPNSNPTACAPSPTSCNSDADCTVGLNTKCERNLCPDSPAFSTYFRCARLNCTPEYRDWGSDFSSLITYVSGDPVVPDSIYHVAHLGASCEGNEAACAAASNELQIKTERWGNVDCSQAVVPGAQDIGFVVSKVRDAVGAFIKPRTQLREAVPNPLGLVNAQDISRSVDSVKGLQYPFTITPCP